MLEHIWPTLPTPLRAELITQCVTYLKSVPDERDALATLVAEITKSRAQAVKSQWRLANYYGTTLAITREPQRASPYFAQTFLAARKDDVAALYSALGVPHKDLALDESAAVASPPTQALFASVLEKGLDGIDPAIVRCMIAVIADTGVDTWQSPARKALEAHLATTSSAQAAVRAKS